MRGNLARFLAGLFLSALASLSAGEVEDLIYERSAAHGADPSLVMRVALCETGRTLRTDLIGASGEVGVGQWLARGAWYATPHYRQWNKDIREMYRQGDPEAPWWDVDALAWAFSPQAPRGFRGQWTCY